VHVGGGIFQAVTHPGLRAQVHHVVGLERIVDAVERGGVGEIRLHETTVLAFLQLGEPGAFELNGIVIVEVVEAEHGRPPALRQTLANVEPDEPGGARNEDFH